MSNSPALRLDWLSRENQSFLGIRISFVAEAMSISGVGWSVGPADFITSSLGPASDRLLTGVPQRLCVSDLEG
jgi:hypothetical protein